jgi:methyl-accepting chemotaxis protein
MAGMVATMKGYFTKRQKFHLYWTVSFLSLSAVAASATIIYYYNEAIAGSALDQVGGRIETSMLTLLPYAISAIIAAITALSVTTIWPVTRSIEPGRELIERMQQMERGDLATKLRVGGNHQLREVVAEMNIATQSIGAMVTQIKVVNRRQWGVLCRIRLALEEGRVDEALRSVGEMERNWDKMAEVEDKLLT